MRNDLNNRGEAGLHLMTQIVDSHISFKAHNDSATSLLTVLWVIKSNSLFQLKVNKKFKLYYSRN